MISIFFGFSASGRQMTIRNTPFADRAPRQEISIMKLFQFYDHNDTTQA
ncbi:hypothetical protein CEV33_1333 [Brucella grignonensis]|uniref:Uncharacterized protein n=1 Tax=Brucella grignonensis TaxID=94627 RepID=A0A256FCF4_9HYPH|nr:hypothetical protein CEV33_1333 [Brucella grignonensis]